VFVTVAEELHFGRAADRLYMTQPAISRHITRLEAGLGVTLLRRTNRHVELTPEGRVFLPAAREMLAAARRAVEAAQLAARGGFGQMRLGSAGTLPNELAVRLMRAFRRDHSAVEILLSQSSYISSPIANVDRGANDIGLVRAPVVGVDVAFEPLVSERRMLVVSAEHPLARQSNVTLAEIAGEPIVTSLSWPQRLRDYWAGVDDGADASYEVSVLADGPGAWLSAVGGGRGVSLCPASIAGYYRRADLAYVTVSDVAPNSVGIAWRRDRDGALLRNFIASAKRYVESHIPEAL
jgi:DNA-binding transcriptional LysR family regulator